MPRRARLEPLRKLPGTVRLGRASRLALLLLLRPLVPGARREPRGRRRHADRLGRPAA